MCALWKDSKDPWFPEEKWAEFGLGEGSFSGETWFTDGSVDLWMIKNQCSQACRFQASKDQENVIQYKEIKWLLKESRWLY